MMSGQLMFIYNLQSTIYKVTFRELSLEWNA